MFLVINKGRLCTYIVSVVIVVMLFSVATKITNKTIEASSDTQKELPIYNVQTSEKKVALTMNCAWNADDIDKILEALKSNNVNITFFMVGDWIEKFPEAAKKIYEAGNEIRKPQRHTSTRKQLKL